MNRALSLGALIATVLLSSIHVEAGNRGHGHAHYGEPIPPKFNPTAPALIKNVRQLELEGRTSVRAKNNCEPGLMGYYTPSQNTITLCLNNARSSGSLLRTLIHEGVHRAQHCNNYELAFSKNPKQLEKAVNRLPAYQIKNILEFYNSDFERLLEVEARLWAEYAGGTDNFWSQWFYFDLSKACGGPMARGYVDVEHWDYCLGGRASHDNRGNRCPNR